MRIHRYTEGILWMIATTFWNSWNAVVMRHLSAVMPLFQLVFLSYLLSLIALLPAIALRGGLARLRTSRWRLFMLRGALEAAGMFLMVNGLTLLPLPVFSALALMTPLLTSVLAVTLLREQGTWRTWVTLIIGMGGALMVIRPGSGSFDYSHGALFMLGASLCFSQCGIIIRKLSVTEPPFTIAVYMFVCSGLCALPAALLAWETPPPAEWIWLLPLGILLALVQYSVAQALSRAPIIIVTPFTFMFLVFSSAIAYLLYGEIVDGWTVSGAAIIITSAVYAAQHNIRKAHRNEPGPY